ncbi:MAG: Gfo/Idh/MocA family oxidoreductase [bacterium]|nr:Gfo/Idh/MocA family oxidoreductase [bacterium]
MRDTNIGKIRVGVVGYGRGWGLCNILKKFPEVELRAVCDSNPKIQDHVKKDHPEVSFYTDYYKMISSGNIDAVLIETPPAYHASYSIAALEKNIHVLSDCPAVVSIKEGEQLWKVAQKSKAIYMFGENVNYWDFIKTCKELKEKGLLGDPVYLEAEYIHDIRYLFSQTPWRETLPPILYITHSLGPIIEWIEEELIAVACMDTGSHINKKRYQHDAMVAVFRTKSDIVVKILCSFINNHPACFHRYVYYGTKGYFERSSPLPDRVSSHLQKTIFSTTQIRGMDGLMELPTSNIDLISEGHGGADYLMVKDFIKAIVKNLPSPIDVKKALKMSLPGVYALESAKAGGKMIAIKYPWNEK